MQQNGSQTVQSRYSALLQQHKNIVFIGEAGCGKSEAAINFAAALAGGPLETHLKEVHLFDLDQTKPIYRSRDARDALAALGINLHHERHDFDSPTIVGGVEEHLTNPNCHALLDVGGGEPGARMIGRFARQLNAANTIVYYIVNPYRPWSMRLEAIDETLSAILRVSRIQKIHLLCNPSLGPGTTAAECVAGLRQTQDLLNKYMPTECVFAREELVAEVEAQAGVPVLPLHLYLKYEWV